MDTRGIEFLEKSASTLPILLQSLRKTNKTQIQGIQFKTLLRYYRIMIMTYYQVDHVHDKSEYYHSDK
jgi:hypothetical protein